MAANTCCSQRPPHHLPEAEAADTETKSNDNLARKSVFPNSRRKAISRGSMLPYILKDNFRPKLNKEYYYYPLLLEEPVLFPELLLETTEIALAMASTADRRSANVFLSDLSASEMKYEHQTEEKW